MEIAQFLLGHEQGGNEEIFLNKVAAITGIKPLKLSDNPAWLADTFKQYSDRLKWRKNRNTDHQYIHDEGMHPCAFSPVLPNSLLRSHTFAITEQMIAFVEVFEAYVQRVPTITELEIIGLLSTKDTVQSKFSNTAINAINALYYSLPDSFSEESGLASMFTNNRIINRAIGSFIDTHVSGNALSIGEICSGRRAAKWTEIASKLPNKSVSIHLSDFVAPTLPDLTQESNVTAVTSEQYSLLDELPFLPDSEKRDVHLATYGFDSVWSEHDARYHKQNGKWYREFSRVKVLDTHPRKDQMIAALRTGTAFPGMQLSDFGSVFVESGIEEVDMSMEANGSIIADELEDSSRIELSYPGGMIHHIQAAFQRQLKQDGIFIIGDTAAISNGERFSTKQSYVSGVAARYKREDYLLAKRILDEFGFTADIYPLNDFVTGVLGEGWKSEATTNEHDLITESLTSVIMVVKKKS